MDLASRICITFVYGLWGFCYGTLVGVVILLWNHKSHHLATNFSFSPFTGIHDQNWWTWMVVEWRSLLNSSEATCLVEVQPQCFWCKILERVLICSVIVICSCQWYGYCGVHRITFFSVSCDTKRCHTKIASGFQVSLSLEHLMKVQHLRQVQLWR